MDEETRVEVQRIARHEAKAAADARVEEVAERAAEKAIEKVYANVGRSVLRRAAWLLGAVLLAAAVFFAGKGTLS